MTITFIGHGYVGLVSAAIFADLGNTVWVVGHTKEKVENLKSRKGITITKKGFSKMLKAAPGMQDKKKRSDGKWIMLIFDVPKRHEKSRKLLRSILKNLGYHILQQSVWVCSFDVLEKTEMLLQAHSLDEYIRIFLIEEM